MLEQLNYNLLFRWFVGLSPDDPIWHPTTFTKNRERLLNEQVMGMFLGRLMGAPEIKPLLSDEHFSVDGTLLQAWASHASLERIDGQDDPPPPPSGPGEGFGSPKGGVKRHPLQGRLKVCPSSPWRSCHHWVSSAGLTAPDARNLLRCS